MDEVREDTDHDEDANEGQGEDLQLINDRSERVYVFHSSEAQLAQALSHGRAIPRIQVAVPQHLNCVNSSCFPMLLLCSLHMKKIMTAWYVHSHTKEWAGE
jgi:hypothetical protein